MLLPALKFLEEQLNTFLARQAGSVTPNQTHALITPLTDSDGKVVKEPARIYLTLSHLEEERLEGKKAIYRRTATGKFIQHEAPVRLNAYLLCSAQAKYLDALNDISLVALFFQKQHSFLATDYPSLNSNVATPWTSLEEISMQLCTLSYEQQSYIWSYMGAKYKPCLLYKMRVLIIFDEESDKEYPFISETEGKPPTII
jgi:hypothetical protein